jgi:hypothetical protein
MNSKVRMKCAGEVVAESIQGYEAKIYLLPVRRGSTTKPEADSLTDNFMTLLEGPL